MRPSLALFVLLAACGAPAARAEMPQRPSEGARPLAYALELTVDPRHPAFSGVVRIDVELDREVSEIALHARELHVRSARVVDPQGHVRIARWVATPRSDVGAVLLPARVGPGRVRLELHYRGWFASDDWGEGLYRTELDSGSYAITQLEPTGARRVFPCFDEPRFRAPFQISLVVPRGYVASANEVIDRREDTDEWMHLHFRETRPLPTHLIGWAVGNFDVLGSAPIEPHAVRDEPVAIRAFAPAGAGPYARALLDEARRVLPAIERALGVPYPFRKLDLVLAPRLPVGGMENAAHVTLRWRRAHAARGELDETDRVVLTHELAHQWLGVLASTARWEEQWVKEAMTEWLTEHVRAQLDGEAAPVRWSLYGAFDAAVLSSSSFRDDALYAAPSSPDLREIVARDNRFRIDRGASLLHAFARWIGPDAMARGMGRAVRERSWQTARLDEYLTAIAASAERPTLARAYRSFVDQPGMPIVRASIDCGGDRPGLRLRQSRYTVLGSQSIDARWSIPVCARHPVDGGIGESCVLLDEADGFLPLEGCPAWALPNAGAAGFHWTTLDEASLDALLEHGWARATTAEQLWVLESLMMAVEDGSLGADALVARVRSLLASPELVQERVTTYLSAARNLFVADEDRAAFDRIGTPALMALYERGGWDDTPQRVLTYLALEAREPRVRADAAERGRRYLEAEPTELDRPGSPGEIAIAVALQEEGAQRAREILTQRPSSRRRVLRALALSDDADEADRAMTEMLSSPAVDSAITALVWRRLRVPGSRARGWRWALSSLDQLVPLRGRRTDPVESLRAMCDEAAADELAEAAARLADPRLARTVHSIRECIAVAREQRPRLRAYLGQGPP